MKEASTYPNGLDRNAANFTALSPLSFLVRSATVYASRPSIVHGGRTFTWAQTYARCKRLASALVGLGVGRGETVAALLPNVPAMVEAHFGVPMAGAVLNTLNTRLDAATLAFMLEHGQAKVLLVDPEFADIAARALDLLKSSKPTVVDVWDEESGFTRLIGEIEYEVLLTRGKEDAPWALPPDEWDAMCLNYTSGTTGDPKGVVYHHRGAYLNAISNAVAWPLPHNAVYLWTLPMFHCNGWCMPWSIAMVGGLNVCLRKIDPSVIAALVEEHHVTHLAGAPIVFSMLVNAWSENPPSQRLALKAMIAGAAPPVAVIQATEKLGIHLTHVYGLTEVYGPAAICVEQPEWGALSDVDRASLKRRQGVTYPLQEEVRVLDQETMVETPHDGKTIGEICFRGNIMMKGYLANPGATAQAFSGGWFHTGDLAVVEADGYIKIKDRSKDVIISGGENISSVEVEEALYQHGAVLAAAVVASPDAKWGEVPCAFVELREGKSVSEAELIKWCRDRMARFKVPKQVVFGNLPKTSTGKIQKFILRERAASASAIE